MTESEARRIIENHVEQLLMDFPGVGLAVLYEDERDPDLRHVLQLEGTRPKEQPDQQQQTKSPE